MSSGGWEYEEYVRDMEEPAWAMLGSQVTRPVVRMEWWSKFKSHIFEDLQEWFNEGWEPMGDIGPDCLVIEETQKTDFIKRGSAIFNRNTYVYLKGFRIQMRRPKK